MSAARKACEQRTNGRGRRQNWNTLQQMDDGVRVMRHREQGEFPGYELDMRSLKASKLSDYQWTA